MRNHRRLGTIVAMSSTPLPVRRPRSGLADGRPELVVTHVPDAAPADLADLLGWLTAESEHTTR